MEHSSCPDGTWQVATARPHPRLRPGVLGYRGFRLDLGRPRRRLEVPTGTAAMVILFEEKLRLTGLSDRAVPAAAFPSLVCGPNTRARTGEHDGRLYGIEVALAPWGAFTLFDTAMYHLADTAVELPDLLGSRADDLAGVLAATPTWPERFTLLDTVLTQWSGGGPAHAPRVAWAWQELVRTAGTITIPALARAVGLSQRQLESRFREQIGLTPKTAARVMRLQRALRLMAEGRLAAEVAAAAGFHDQAHLGHECKAMTGCTPRRFLAHRAAARRDPSAGDRLEGQSASVLLPT